MARATIGSGEYSYEFVPGWERLPSGWEHGDVPAVSTDSEGNVFVYCRGAHPVVVYDRAGRFLDCWGEGIFGLRTHGMYMNGDQLLLVDEGNSLVGRFSLDGRLLQTFGPRGAKSDTGYDGSSYSTVTRGGPPYNRPTNAALSRSGDVYVSDGYGNSRIHRFSGSGELLQSWGEPGSGRSQLNVPHGLWVRDDGTVLVADRENDRIQCFDAEGNYLQEWTNVRRPQDLFVDEAGLVFVGEGPWKAGAWAPRRGVVSTAEPARISILDRDGNVVARLNSPAPGEPGFFLSPHDLWVDDEGSIYVAVNAVTAGGVFGIQGADSLLKFARM